MARPKPRVFDQYRFGVRGVLAPGDCFRVTGGPIYVTDGGTKIPMYVRGIFQFHRYCEQGAAKWIEAYRADGGGFVVLWVGKSGRSKTIPNLRRRPYRITGKVGAKTSPSKRKPKSKYA
jgi:hypothetical protein